MDKQNEIPRHELLQSFQNSLSISFSNIILLETALTHRSCRDATVLHNERLEFLGDSVLGLAVAQIVYSALEGRPEGELASVKSRVVSEQVLSGIAEQIGLPGIIRLGRGEELSGGRQKKAILADALEALIGALYLDQGFESAFELVKKLLEKEIHDALKGSSKDWKTILQEFAQKEYKNLPVYSLTKTEGPDHARLFHVTCEIAGKIYGPYAGKTIKEAERLAAENVCRTLARSSRRSAKLIQEIAGLQR